MGRDFPAEDDRNGSRHDVARIQGLMGYFSKEGSSTALRVEEASRIVI